MSGGAIVVMVGEVKVSSHNKKVMMGKREGMVVENEIELLLTDD